MSYIWHAKKSVASAKGTIIITTNTATYIEGEFSFDGVRAIKIAISMKKFTNGSFRVMK